MDRRRLLHLAAAAAFQSHALDRVRAATSNAGSRTPEEIAADEDFWSEIRAAFSIDRNIINFNNGYVSTSPRPVPHATRPPPAHTHPGPHHTMLGALPRTPGPG